MSLLFSFDSQKALAIPIGGKKGALTLPFLEWQFS